LAAEVAVASVAAEAAASAVEVPVVAGEQKPLPRRPFRRVEIAVDEAERETGLQFCVYLGPSGASGSRAHAERLFVDAGLDTRPAVLVMVDPENRRVEVVTAPDARSRVDDEAARRAVDAMTVKFAKGNLSGGIVAGIRHLAEAAGAGEAAPGSEELPDVVDESAEGRDQA
jgi:uncharacterized membrane protein YgcG